MDVGEGLVQRCAADQHDVVVAHALFLQRVDDDLHVRHRRRQQRRHAQDVGLVLLDRLEIVLDGIVDAEVDDLEAGAFHHHADEVLADVVDVALHGADDHLADLRSAGLGQQRAQDEHARLHGVGRHQHFGHEEDAVPEVLADDAHALDERRGQNLIGRPFASQEDAHALLDLFLEPIVEVIVHLLDEFVVGEGIQVEIVSASHLHQSPASTPPVRR